jgi:hypothetical protein
MSVPAEHIRVLSEALEPGAPHQPINNYATTVLAPPPRERHPWLDYRVRQLESKGVDSAELRALRDATSVHDWVVICLRYSDTLRVSVASTFRVRNATAHDVESALMQDKEYVRTERVIWRMLHTR